MLSHLPAKKSILRFMMIASAVFCCAHFPLEKALSNSTQCRSIFKQDLGKKIWFIKGEEHSLSPFNTWIKNTWSSNFPMYVKVGKNRFPITLSFDGEIPARDWANLLHEYPGLGKQFLEHMAKGRSKNDEDQLLKLTKGTSVEGVIEFINNSDLASENPAAKVSPASFRSFYLKKSSQDRARITLLDLNSFGLNQVLAIDGQYSATTFMQKALTKIFIKEDRDVKATIDGHDVELTHKSYEKNPKEYADLIQEVFAEFKNIQMHFHFGVPKEVGDPQAISIARTIESIITLRLAVDAPFNKTAFAFTGGAFSYSGNRGLVKFSLNEWSKPHPTHDIEIRQWDDPKHGMQLLATGAYLTLNHEKLILPKADPKLTKMSGSDLHGSLYQSLIHIGTILGKKNDPSLNQASDALLNLAKKMHSSKANDPNDLSPGMARQVARTLNRFDLETLFQPENFLKD